MVGGTTQRFDIQTTTEGDTGVVRVIGDLDISTAPRLISAVRDVVRHPVQRIELNCDQVEFVDSAGIRALIVGRNEAVGVGIDLVLAETSPSMRRVLDITGLAPILASP